MGPRGTGKGTERGKKAQLWSDLHPMRTTGKYIEEEMDVNREKEGVRGDKATREGSQDEMRCGPWTFGNSSASAPVTPASGCITQVRN